MDDDKFSSLTWIDHIFYAKKDNEIKTVQTNSKLSYFKVYNCFPKWVLKISYKSKNKTSVDEKATFC